MLANQMEVLIEALQSQDKGGWFGQVMWFRSYEDFWYLLWISTDILALFGIFRICQRENDIIMCIYCQSFYRIW